MERRENGVGNEGVMMGESKVKERVWREGKIKWLGEWRQWGISHCGYQATVATW